MRFWLWLNTGTITKQWMAMHRKHHKDVDKEGDPHSPWVFGIKNVVFKGWLLYYITSKNTALIEAYGAGAPDDWIERNLYTPHCFKGIFLLLFINILLFGYWGIAIWLIQITWLPWWGSFVNGLAHYVGYRNYDTDDRSTNLTPWGIFLVGEELHHNHHYNPAQVNQNHKPGEIDLGWIYLKIFIFLGLAKLPRERA
jgi:stearoyl-CoA desaturase (delta-9 desaturase)